MRRHVPKKPSASVRSLSKTEPLDLIPADITNAKKYVTAVCRKCSHEWLAKTERPLKCSKCQTIKPITTVFYLAS